MTDNPSNQIRVFVIDNHTLVRAGVSLLIDKQADLKVVGQVGRLAEAISQLPLAKPDIILIEHDPDNGFGFDVFPKINEGWKKARMILVTGASDCLVYLHAMHHGVLGVVLKTQPPEVLIKAVRKVANGEVWIERSLMANLLTNMFQDRSATPEEYVTNCIEMLSERERGVIELIGRGLKNKQIGSELCISEATVRHHLSSIYGKLGVADRLELLVFAHSHKLTKDHQS